jgi:transposase-like protein
MPEKNKLSRADRAIILARAAAGERYADIARDYGVTGPAIRYVVTRGPLSAPPPPEPVTTVPLAVDPAERPGVCARLDAADRVLALLADTIAQTRTIVATLRRSLATVPPT